MDTKVCTGCNEDKDVELFGMKRGKKNTRCKACVNKYYKEIYYANPDRKQYVINRNKENSAKYFELAKEIIIDAMKDGCVSCGIKDIRVLEFDHLDPKTKEYTVTSLVRSNSIDKLKEEIKKCQILCANCHRIKTNAQFNYWRNAAVYPLADNE